MLDDRLHGHSHIMKEDRAIRKNDALHRRMGDVALMPEDHIFKPGHRVAAEDAREARNPL